MKSVKYFSVVLGIVMLMSTNSYAVKCYSVSPCTNTISSVFSREKSIDVNARDKEGNTPLHLAMDQNGVDLDLVRLLIERGANVNAKNAAGQTPLERVFTKNLSMKVKINVSRILLENGAYIDMKSNMCRTIEESILFNGGRDLAGLMFEKNVNLKGQLMASDCTWLHEAVLRNRKDVVEVLLESGANVNARNAEDKTPLHVAISRNHKDIAWLLLNPSEN